MLRRSVSKHIFRRGPDDSSYHTKYYDLRNVSVVIIGKVSHVRLLQVLQTKVESSILAKRKPDSIPWERCYPISLH